MSYLSLWGPLGKQSTETLCLIVVHPSTSVFDRNREINNLTITPFGRSGLVTDATILCDVPDTKVIRLGGSNKGGTDNDSDAPETLA